MFVGIHWVTGIGFGTGYYWLQLGMFTIMVQVG